MRILTITNLYPNPFHPNRATFNRQQFRALAARHPMRIISPIAWTDELRARWNGAARIPAGRTAERDGIAVSHPLYLFPPKVMRGLYADLFRRCVRRSFQRALDEFRPDLILGSWAYPDGRAALDLGRRAGLPVVIKVHGSDVLTQAGFPARLQKTIETLRAADGIVAVSRDLSEKIASFGVPPERIRLVYNGVDTDRFQPGPRDEARARLGLDAHRPTLLYVGNLLPVKGVDVLIEACGRLARAAAADFACYVVGQGPLRPALEARIAELSIAQKVKLVGAKPHEQLPDWFRAADALVLPSRSEGVPNVLMEACATGIPFVASRVGGIPEVTHLGRGELVPAEDPDALASAMGRVLASAGAVPAAAGAGFRSHDIAAAELSDFLEETVARFRQTATHAA